MNKLLVVFIFLFTIDMQVQAQPVPPPPPDGYYRWHYDDYYYRSGLQNDRYPPQLYYWHPKYRRYYPRYYVATYRYVRCNDGVVRPASRVACRRYGGVLYYY